MKAKLIILPLILLGISSWNGFCQTEYNYPGFNETSTEPLLYGELYTPYSPPDITTYFNKTWLEGDIWLTDGSIVRNKKIKYNGFLDELFWLEPSSNKIIKLDKEAILQFHFLNFQGDTSVYFSKLKAKGNILSDSTEIYGQLLYRGDLSLFVLHSFYKARRDKIQINNSYFLKDIYKEEPEYYIKFLNNEVAVLKRFNRKNLYALAPGKKDQVKQFLRENISGIINTDHEIIEVVKFLNSVVDQ